MENTFIVDGVTIGFTIAASVIDYSNGKRAIALGGLDPESAYASAFVPVLPSVPVGEAPATGEPVVDPPVVAAPVPDQPVVNDPPVADPVIDPPVEQAPDQPVSGTDPEPAAVESWKLNFTDADHPSGLADWIDIDLENADKVYLLSGGVSLDYSLVDTISHGQLSPALNDADFPDAVLSSQIYMNEGQINLSFKGLDPASKYNIKVGCYSDDNKPTQFYFNAMNGLADPNKSLAKLLFGSLTPDDTGLIKGLVNGPAYFCLNALILEKIPADGKEEMPPVVSTEPIVDAPPVEVPPAGNPIVDAPPAEATGPASTGTSPDEPVTDELLPEEKLFDAAHFAKGAKLDPANGSIISFPDKIGGNDLVYAGVAAPAMNDLPPLLIENGAFAEFLNRPDTQYHSALFKAVKPVYEIWYVTRTMPGQQFEAKSEGNPVSGYLANDGQSMRIIFSNVDIPGVVQAPDYELTIERMVVNKGGADYWRNGQLLGSVTDLSAGGANKASDITGNTTKTMHGLSTSNNCPDFDFAAMYFKAGGFSADDAAKIYTALAAEYNAGSMPNEILLSQIAWNNVNGVYTPSARVISTPAGVSVAPMNQWGYEWYWKTAATNFAVQKLFSTKMIVTEADFPEGYASEPGFSIKVRMKPVATNGDGWRFLSGVFGSYTNGNSIE